MNGYIFETNTGWHGIVNSRIAGPYETRRQAVFATCGMVRMALPALPGAKVRQAGATFTFGK